ncbi:MAG TPA: hypothetical protein VKT80_06165, partial [Chloroflexota bacterium]|nr:hypothetical protein [Chloroflexota bacterium]
MTWRAIPSGNGAFRRAIYLAGESAWLTVAASVLGLPVYPDGTRSLPGPATLLVALVVAALATRLSLSLPIGDQLRGKVVVATALVDAIVLGSIAAIPIGSMFDGNAILWVLPGRVGLVWVGSVLLFLVAGWRGVPAGRDVLDAETVNRSLRTSASALAVLFLVNGLTGRSINDDSGLYVTSTIVVVATGLIGLPLARLDQLARTASASEGDRLRTSREWLGMLIG